MIKKTESCRGQSEAERAVQQLADVCHRALGLKCVISPDGASFRGIAPDQGPYQGLLAVDGRLVAHEGDIRAIAIALKLASVPETLHVALPQLLDRVAGLGDEDTDPFPAAETRWECVHRSATHRKGLPPFTNPRKRNSHEPGTAG